MTSDVRRKRHRLGADGLRRRLDRSSAYCDQILKRACLEHGCRNYVQPPERRCPEHALPARKRPHHEAKYAGDWQRRSREIREQWISEHGYVCPGWQCEPHPSQDLTVDHEVGVLCRACNGRKGGGFDKIRGTLGSTEAAVDLPDLARPAP